MCFHLRAPLTDAISQNTLYHPKDVHTEVISMLVPGQEAVIEQSFRLMLEQAQLAVLGRDNGLYQRYIDNGIEWLRRYTLLESASGQSVLAELTDLRSLDVNPSLPGLSASLSALEQLAATVR